MDQEIMNEVVCQMMVNLDRTLEFHFYDGTTKVQTWKSTAKKDYGFCATTVLLYGIIGF